MIDIISEKYMRSGERIPFGQQNENLARRVSFDMSYLVLEFGLGSVKWLVRRPGEMEVYEAENTEVDGFLNYLNLTSKETAVEGEGALEIIFETEDARYLTKILKTKVNPSITP